MSPDGHDNAAGTIVVTGASGFLGRCVTGALSRRGALVLPVSRRAGVGIVQVRDYTESPGGDVLIHLAEERDRVSAASSGDALERQAEETLAALLAKGWQRIVYASSALLYAGGATPRKPGDALRIDDTYARMKQSGERAVAAAAGVPVIARMTNIYGPGMATNNVVSDILGQIPGDGPLRVRDTNPVRDFVWVDDAAAALAAMATKAASPPGGTFNVGGGEGISIGALARLALDIAGTPDREVISVRPTGEPSSVVLDIGDTTAKWGWRPVVRLRTGLQTLLSTASADRGSSNG